MPAQPIVQAFPGAIFRCPLPVRGLKAEVGYQVKRYQGSDVVSLMKVTGHIAQEGAEARRRGCEGPTVKKMMQSPEAARVEMC